jgi:phospholipid-binding lipoprotein MlaA
MKLPTAREALPSGRTCGVSKRNCDVAKPAFALTSYGAVHLALHPCSPLKMGSPPQFRRTGPLCSDKLQGIRAKANKREEDLVKRLLLIIVLSAIFSVGFVHKSPSSSLASEGTSSYQNHDPESYMVSQTEQKQEETEQEWLDDDLDFLDEEEELVEIADPIFYWNTAMYHFNDKFYFWLLKPVTRGYKWAAPEIVRIGVKNFFYNLRFPIRFVSCILQGKGDAAGSEFCRFMLNSTVGVLGFGNPAKHCPELTPSEEDLGQTFGRWGIGNGFYVVWPLIGPSTLRDSFGLLGDHFLDPVTYVNPTEAAIGIIAYDTVNKTSFRIGDYESLKEGAIDPYLSIRDAYIQNRKKKVDE